MDVLLKIALCVSLSAPALSLAQAPPEDAPVRELDTVEVIAQVPGPGLWEVRSDGRVLWILGTQSPLPKRFEWVSDDLAARLAESSLLIAPPSVDFKGVGMVRGLFLLPSLYRSRRDPEGRSLEENVGPELYAQWLEHKQRYFPRKRKTDTWRPMVAAIELYSEAIEDQRLTGGSDVWKTVRRLARRQRVDIIEPEVELRIEDPRGAIRSFAENPLDDLDCFRLTMQHLESDLQLMRDRAEAWAVGDVEGLRALPLSDQNQACRDAFLEAAVSRETGFDALPDRLRAAWLEAARGALAEHESSVAVLPIRFLIDPDKGAVAALRAEGYEVIEPGAESEFAIESGPPPRSGDTE
jgi:hypothetical protein